MLSARRMCCHTIRWSACLHTLRHGDAWFRDGSRRTHVSSLGRSPTIRGRDFVKLGSAVGHQVALQASFNIDLIQKLSFQAALYTNNLRILSNPSSRGLAEILWCCHTIPWSACLHTLRHGDAWFRDGSRRTDVSSLGRSPTRRCGRQVGR